MSFARTTASPVYLDHAATTPMLDAAVRAMTATLTTTGNASSLHGSGRAARRRIEEARESVAADLGARPSEVVFTSGGTESDNLAIKGIYWARRGADPHRTRLVVSAVEHHAVLDAVEWLERHENAVVTWIPVDADGRVTPGALREAIGDGADVALVSVMWANNEVGTIMPIRELASVAAEFDIPVHTDAVQAVGHLDVDFAASGVAALSLAAHKFGGPQGVGALVIGRTVGCEPQLHGGGHERDLRSGTHDVAGIVGAAAALRAVCSDPSRDGVRALRDLLLDEVLRIDPDAIVNGPTGSSRLPNNAHVTFPGCDGDSLLMLLDAAGIECSTGSACTAGVARPSHVLTAMGMDPGLARGSLRFTLGHTTTEADVRALAEALPDVLERARAAGRAVARAI
ncbi:cysteine desulfurase [Rhodococcus rhodnii]|uniref:Cysteine desulfurase n=2 Tax=Rhodococcus rhodnii TaxID=38312 RepID=R7WLP2_9NOCA|nr:cysteine desulfurase family protein [Rhodococcus rhodnii]EOM76205.1 cysteine desulfurase [Rhodococcus rhodnii LMG 5362]TXG90763.1 cysteine desulfurase [Rhodococcus rhodnii]